MVGELLALATAVFWALNPVFSRKALDYGSAVSLNVARSLFGSLSLWVVLFYSKGVDFLNVDLLGLVLVVAAGLVGVGLGDLVFFKSMSVVGVSVSVAVSSVYPIFTAAASLLFLGEDLDVLDAVGIVCIVLSVSLVSLSEKERRRGSLKGVLLGLASAVLWSAAITLVALGVRRVDPIAANAYRFSFLTVILAGVLVVGKGFGEEFRRREFLFWSWASGVTGLTLGTTAYLESIRLIGAAKATALTSVYPVVSGLAALAVLREKPSLKVWAGLILTAVGVALLQV